MKRMIGGLVVVMAMVAMLSGIALADVIRLPAISSPPSGNQRILIVKFSGATVPADNNLFLAGIHDVGVVSIHIPDGAKVVNLAMDDGSDKIINLGSYKIAPEGGVSYIKGSCPERNLVGTGVMHGGPDKLLVIVGKK